MNTAVRVIGRQVKGFDCDAVLETVEAFERDLLGGECNACDLDTKGFDGQALAGDVPLEAFTSQQGLNIIRKERKKEAKSRYTLANSVT